MSNKENNNINQYEKLKASDKTHLLIPKSCENEIVNIERHMNYQKFLNILAQLVIKYSE